MITEIFWENHYGIATGNGIRPYNENLIARIAIGKIKIDFSNFTGTYSDNWFGDIVLSQKKGKLYFKSKRSPQLTGEVFFYKNGNFVVKWNNAYFNADAHLFFEFDATGKAIGIKMKPISELTDFSYDFQDLDFKRVENSMSQNTVSGN